MDCKAVIFDLDGVICFTDKYHYLAWKTLADRLGIYFDEVINNRLRGVSRMASLEIILVGNLLVNGDFDLGLQYWTSGKNAAIGQPYFEAVALGGIDGGPYLQAYGNGGPDHAASLKQIIDIEAGKDYYFRAASRKGGANQKVSLSTDGKESEVVAKLDDSDDWQKQSFIFNSGSY